MKKILLISSHFAPETHAAMYRVHKLAKYLKEYGWEPIILTTDTNYNYNENTQLLKELNDIKIYRAKYIEPTFRGIKMALGGADRTYKTLKKNTNYSTSSKSTKSVKTNKNTTNLPNRLLTFIQNDLLKVPDQYWTWKNPAIKLGRAIIKKENIKYIFSTSPQFTTAQIALKLKQEFQLKWVADFRDPMTTVLRNHSEIEKIYIKQRRIKHQIFKKADKVTTASYAHNLILHDVFKGEGFDKIQFIPTGLDESYLKDIKQKNTIENYILYSGEYLIENGTTFFDLFNEVIQNEEIKKLNLRIKIVGNAAINKELLEPYFNKNHLINCVDFIDHVPQTELYKLIINAKACLLQSEGRWWCSFAKMVDYIALRKPVLCFTPQISEANTQLRNAGLGIFFNEDQKSNESTLLKALKNPFDSSKINHDFCERYTAKSQVKSFSTLLNSL